MLDIGHLFVTIQLVLIKSELQKFMYYVLKSSEVLEILVPILFFLVDSREDTCKSLKKQNILLIK